MHGWVANIAKHLMTHDPDPYNFKNYPQITCLPQPIDNQHKTSKTTKTGCRLQLEDFPTQFIPLFLLPFFFPFLPPPSFLNLLLHAALWVSVFPHPMNTDWLWRDNCPSLSELAMWSLFQATYGYTIEGTCLDKNTVWVHYNASAEFHKHCFDKNAFRETKQTIKSASWFLLLRFFR